MSAQARFRVRIGDGFDETIAVSGPLVVAGRRPRVRIREPERGATFAADAGVYVMATATDDAFRDLTNAVEWFDARRRLAAGNPALLSGLRPGRHKLRAVARDGQGRKGVATVTVRVLRSETGAVVTAPR